MSETYRILVTGSRDWDDRQVVREALAVAALFESDTDDVVIVHGACPSGADRMASDWVRERFAVRLGFREEAHRANWQINGKRAGFIRNQHMVNLGADVCIAFIKGGSRGASHTAALAEQAGIPTRRWTA